MRRALLAIGFLSASAVAAPASSQPEAEAGLSRQVTPAPAELPLLSLRIIAKMSAARATIREDLQAARAQRDVVKALCLSDKLTQIDVAIRGATERRASLDLALGRNDVEQATHELTIMGFLQNRADALRAEASQCIGIPDIIDEDKVRIRWYLDFELPEDDPAEQPISGIVAEPPSCSSCFR
jgi:hypothetical protein